MFNRIIAPMLIKDGFLVQSREYEVHLPLGDIEESALQLEYFNIDEFTLISLDGMRSSVVDIELLGRLRSVTSFPISYAGGVTSLEQLRRAFDFGAERVVVNRMLFRQKEEVREFTRLVGRQGIVGSIDITSNKSGECFVKTFDSFERLDVNHVTEVSSIVGEINLGLIDWEGSCKPYSYDKILSTLRNLIQNIKCPVTLYGGSSWFDYTNLATENTQKLSIMVDNILSYKEDSVNEFHKKLTGL